MTCQRDERHPLLTGSISSDRHAPALAIRRGGVSPISVDLRPGESQESLLKRFRKAVAEARILPIVRQKRWFTSKSEIKRIKRQKAIRKAQRAPRRRG
ncbi:MAG: 30S ribosomal protein S21 [Chloroflexota bacterium]|nr:30S ribosomal protein S21 [Chloroflexota bacterium]